MELVRIKRELAKGEKNPVMNVDPNSLEKCITTAMEDFKDLGGIPIDMMNYQAEHTEEEKCSVQLDTVFGYIREVTETDVGVELTMLGDAFVKAINDTDRIRVQFVFVVDSDPSDESKYIATRIIKGNILVRPGGVTK